MECLDTDQANFSRHLLEHWHAEIDRILELSVLGPMHSLDVSEAVTNQ